MKNSIVFLSLLITLLLSSCGDGDGCGNDKAAYFTNFEALIEEIAEQNNATPLTDEQWQQYDDRLDHFTDACFKKFEKDFSTSDQLTVATYTGSYLYARYGVMAAYYFTQQEEAIQKALLAVDPAILIKVATEIVKNPEEISKIMDDLRARYDK